MIFIEKNIPLDHRYAFPPFAAGHSYIRLSCSTLPPPVAVRVTTVLACYAIPHHRD